MAIKKNIYISCALTNLKPGIFKPYSDFIKNIALGLKNKGYQVTYALENSDPQLANYPDNKKPSLCYIWDKEMVENADLILADVSFPSIGVGIELQLACNRNVPIILSHSDFWTEPAQKKQYQTESGKTCNVQIGQNSISLMALGLPNVKNICTYNMPNELFEKLNDLIEQETLK